MSSLFFYGVGPPGSFGIVRGSLTPTTSKQIIPPDLQNFKKIVADLKNSDDPSEAIDFFLQMYEKDDVKQFRNAGIGSDINRIVRRVSSRIKVYLECDSLPTQLITFLNVSVPIHATSKQTNEAYINIFFNITLTDDICMIQSAMPFLQSFLQCNELIDLLFSYENLANLFEITFVQFNNIYQACGQLITSVASTKKYNEIAELQKFMDSVRDNLNEHKIEPEVLADSIVFIGYIIHSINTCDFLPEILQFICDMAPLCDNLLFFQILISVPTSDPPSIWCAIDAILSDPNLDPALAESAIYAIYETKVSPDAEVFSFSCIIPKILQINEKYQERLYDIVMFSTREVKIDFIANSSPISANGISTKRLKEIVESEEWGEQIYTLFQFLLVDPTDDEVDICLKDDEFFAMILYLINQLDPTSEQNANLFRRLKLYPELHVPLMMKIQPSIYMACVLELIDEDSCLDHFANIGRSVDNFTETFIEAGGLNYLPKLTESLSGLSFIGSLAPNKLINQYLYEHFEETALKDVSKDVLKKLVMGKNQINDEKNGVLKISSLAAKVDIDCLKTPFEQYWYGRASQKYFTATCEQAKLFISRYIPRNQAFSLLMNYEMLPFITDNSFPHHEFYQISPYSVSRTIIYQRPDMLSFWIMIHTVEDQTVLFSVNNIEVAIKENGYLTIVNNDMYFELKKWHLFTIKTNTDKQVDVLLDLQKIASFVTAGNPVIGFSKSTQSHALWFISPWLYTTNDQNIEQIFEGGATYQSEKRLKPHGFTYVRYSGVLKYLPIVGGASYIFDLMLKAETVQQFSNSIKGAFNLYRIGGIGEELFISSLQYVLKMKSDFYPEIEELLINEFKNGFTWKQISLFLSDYNCVDMNRILSVQKHFPKTKEAIRFIHFCIDLFVFYDFDDDKILDIVEEFIHIDHAIFGKLVFVIIGLPFIESDKVQPLYDETKLSKQEKIFSLCEKYPEYFIETFDFVSIMKIGTRIHKELIKKFFKFIGKLVTTYPKYFSIKGLEKSKTWSRLMDDCSEKWLFLLTCLTNQQLQTIDEYRDIPIVRFEVIHIIFYIITTTSKYSAQILNLLYDRMINDSKNFSQFSYSIQGLCGFEYSRQTLEPLPFPRSRDFSFEKQFASENETSDHFYKKYEVLDTTLFVPLQKYLKSIPISDDLNDDYVPPKIENWNDELCNLAAKFAVKVLNENSEDTQKFNHSLIQLTVFGSDMMASAAIHMHHIVIMRFLSQNKINNFQVLLDFLTHRISEGWWKDEVDSIFLACLNHFSNKIQFNEFVITSIEARLSNETIKKFIASQHYSQLKQSSQHFHSFLLLLTNNDELKNELNIPDGKPILTNPYSLSSSMQFTFHVHLKNVSSIRKEIALQPIEGDVIRALSEQGEKPIECRRALRFQFFMRLNQNAFRIDKAIMEIYKLNYHNNLARNPPNKYFITPNPHPMVAPMKLLPLVFEYEAQYKKSAGDEAIPFSVHENKLNTHIESIKKRFIATKSFEQFCLPSYSFEHFTSFLEHELDTGEPFDCALLYTIEKMKCVACFNHKFLYIVLNIQVDSKEPGPNLCNYSMIESAFHGVFGSVELLFSHPMLVIPFSDIVICQPHKFVQRSNSLDIFTISGAHITILASRSKIRKLNSRINSTKSLNLSAKRGPLYSSRLINIGLQDVIDLWSNQHISNFDYLLYLNYIGGRTFNDLSQYPVFPWIISDYETSSFPTTIRDLSKPMGQLTEARVEKYKSVFSETGYHYGTHYSYPAAVLYFKMRVEPFTLYNVILHQGFDHYDRLFYSINESWKSASESSQTDVKELIPELYCFSPMLSNVNCLELGVRTDGSDVCNVLLPPWGPTPNSFIWKMRTTLESRIVEKALPKWIDLIFGYLQRGQEAVDAGNVFIPLSYDMNDERVHNDEEAATILNFGECPLQLFKTQHPTFHYHYRKRLRDTSFRCVEVKEVENDDVININVYEDELYYETKFSYNINHNVLDVSHSIFKISASSISSDSTMICCVSKVGIVQVSWACDQRLISLAAFPELAPLKSCAVSAHFGLICVASASHLILVDVTSSILMRKIEICDDIKFILFDETNNFIVTCSRNKMIVFDLALSIVAEQESTSKINCLALSDSISFFSLPCYATGHEDGSIKFWTLHVCNQALESDEFIKVNESPVRAISFFNDGCAMVFLHESHKLFVASSITTNQRPVLKLSLFKKCSVCNKEMKVKFCQSCGLSCCKNCFSKVHSTMCKQCEALHNKKGTKDNEKSDSASI